MSKYRVHWTIDIDWGQSVAIIEAESAEAARKQLHHRLLGTAHIDQDLLGDDLGINKTDLHINVEYVEMAKP